MTTLGRGGFGIIQATSSRYSTPIILLYIAVLQLCYLSSGAIKEKIVTENKLILQILRLSFVFLMAFLLLTSSTKALYASNRSMVQRSHGKACLESISLDILITPEQKNCLSLLHPNPDQLVKEFILLKRLKLR